MVCEHLRELDEELTRRGIEVVYRDRQPWPEGCRNWTRYACYLDLASIRMRINFAPCVSDYDFQDNWQGHERGFVCEEHEDAVIGDQMKIEGRPVIT